MMVVCVTTSSPVAAINLIEINIGHPHEASAWTFAGIFSGGRDLLGDIAPCSAVWIRIRTSASAV
jgi:hypothetical protein